MQVTQPLRRACVLHPERVLTVSGSRTRTVAESAERVARLAGACEGSGYAPATGWECSR